MKGYLDQLIEYEIKVLEIIFYAAESNVKWFEQRFSNKGSFFFSGEKQDLHKLIIQYSNTILDFNITNSAKKFALFIDEQDGNHQWTDEMQSKTLVKLSNKLNDLRNIIFDRINGLKSFLQN